MKLWICALVVVAVGGCATAIVMPTDADVGALRAQYPETTLADLQRGRSLYVARCAGCHQLHTPSERAPDEWPRVVQKMAKDAGLADSDRALVERYLMAASSRSRRAPAEADGVIAASR